MPLLLMEFKFLTFLGVLPRSECLFVFCIVTRNLLDMQRSYSLRATMGQQLRGALGSYSAQLRQCARERVWHIASLCAGIDILHLVLAALWPELCLVDFLGDAKRYKESVGADKITTQKSLMENGCRHDNDSLTPHSKDHAK